MIAKTTLKYSPGGAASQVINLYNGVGYWDTLHSTQWCSIQPDTQIQYDI